MGVNKNIKFSPTLCKYFAVLGFDISSGIYEQYFYKHGRISPRLDGSRDGCMFLFEFDVFHKIIHSNQVKHSTKHRGID